MPDAPRRDQTLQWQTYPTAATTMQQNSRAFPIHDLAVGEGRIGVSRLPGRNGNLAGDIEAIRDWGAAAVVSMTTEREMADV